MKYSFGILITILIHIVTYGQEEGKTNYYPEVGRPMPSFVLSDVKNYSKTQISLSDFHGKWLILDWWTQFCSTCIESFPEINLIQKELGNNVQFVFVSYTGSWLYGSKIVSSNKTVRIVYERAKHKENLIVPFAFDSTLYQRFNLGTCPYIVIIDPKGVVSAITSHVTLENLKDIIQGKQVSLSKAYRLDQAKPKLDLEKPYLVYGNGGVDTSFLFRSLLSLWDPNKQPVISKSNIYNSYYKGRFEVLGVSLAELYKYAYFGKTRFDWKDSMYGNYSEKVIFETRDSSSFTKENKMLYCYSLIVPKDRADRNYLMEVMQRDLKNYFGYEAIVESKIVPCWKLVATELAKVKLTTQCEKPFYIDNNKAGFAYYNYPIEILINRLSSNFQNEPPFINETGIKENIDIEVNALLTNFEDFKKSLNENGLDLVKGEKNMTVLIIRDR